MSKTDAKHQPVLLTQTLSYLNIQQDAWYVDGTFGRGGHTGAMLAAGGNVLAMDIDAEAIAFGQETFAAEIAAGKLLLVRENFSRITEVLASRPQVTQLTGALFDLGTSLDQLTHNTRGFSFTQPENALDMRMDDRLAVTAADLLNALPEKHLLYIFREYGGEFQSRAVARAVIAQRARQPFATVGDLVNLIEKVKTRNTGHLHPATKVFQALRIAVNDELSMVKPGLSGSFTALQPGGVIVTIAFHEGEDRIAKHMFRNWEESGQAIALTKHPLSPDDEEVARNPRSRSAKLRAVQKQQNHVTT